MFPEIVDLNVGGRHITTFLATLTKYPDSMLAAMFSGRHQVTQDKDGRYFLDVDGDVFIHILNFLRLQTLPPQDKAADVLKYAEYFHIVELINKLQHSTFLSETVLRAKWASYIPGYSDYLESAKNQLTQCQIREGLIYLQISSKPCASKRHGIQVYNGSCLLEPYIDYSVINLHTENSDVSFMKTLVSLLINDLKELGIFSYHGILPGKSCCKYGKMLKV